ncbi:MAG TPA: cytochrome b N-terminal domain-containing protein [Bryobacteraceae bacterium]|jgi:ubiquinol-cytochrome c reductase cytochrome b subunit|nr:cytochrome b N-terminal domain-containing protein [Bryobacteraceae bacterium]
MRKTFEQFIEDLDHRTGLHSGLRRFLYEEIPASSGWHQVFGSVALFLILIQFFTGAMLAFNYAPTPGDAYSSLRYILTEVTAGRLMRGLHHWGASMIIVIVVLHMVQVFLWGAYKKPREGTWIVGAILLLLTLAYGLTGYLLPWDNRAYFGTVVTTKIGATVPLLGPYVSRLLGSSGDIGVVTFARFYGLHVLLLPPATMLLIVLHVYLVRRHGVAPALGDDARPKKSFFPEQVFKDTVAVFVAFAILFIMAIAVRVPLERMADPTITSYTPRPEWYFLFLFQTLEVLRGAPDVIGTVVLPTIAILALMLTPFIDRSKLVRVRQRTLAAGIVLLAALGWGGLTGAAILGTPPPTAASQIDYSGPIQWMQLTPTELAGVHYFRQEKCATCHNITGDTPKTGPNLLNTSKRHDADWLMKHFMDPASVTKGSVMKPVDLSDTELKELLSLMMKLTPENGDVVDSAPDFAVNGALIFQKNSCGTCHSVNGVGGKIGRPLNGLAQRRNEAWVIQHFQNPQMLSPGSPMPSYKFTPSEMQDEVSYLFTLPDKAPGQ